MKGWREGGRKERWKEKTEGGREEEGKTSNIQKKNG